MALRVATGRALHGAANFDRPSSARRAPPPLRCPARRLPCTAAAATRGCAKPAVCPSLSESIRVLGCLVESVLSRPSGYSRVHSVHPSLVSSCADPAHSARASSVPPCRPLAHPRRGRGDGQGLIQGRDGVATFCPQRPRRRPCPLAHAHHLLAYPLAWPPCKGARRRRPCPLAHARPHSYPCHCITHRPSSFSGPSINLEPVADARRRVRISTLAGVVILSGQDK